MQEQEPKPGQIPAHWQFPERGITGLEILQCDEDERFLYMRWDDLVRRDTKRAYFFNEDGTPRDRYTSRELFTEIILGRESKVNLSFIKVLNGPFRTLSVGFTRNVEREIDSGERDLARLEFGSLEPNLKSLSIGVAFVVLTEVFWENEDEIIFSPRISIGPREIMQIPLPIATEWRIFRSSNRYSFSYESQTSALFYDKEGTPTYMVSWQMEGLQVVITQHHLQRDIKKIVRTPVVLPIVSLHTVFAAPLPNSEKYQRSENGKLIVPWTDLDKLTKTSFGYIYPPPSTRQSSGV